MQPCKCYSWRPRWREMFSAQLARVDTVFRIHFEPLAGLHTGHQRLDDGRAGGVACVARLNTCSVITPVVYAPTYRFSAQGRMPPSTSPPHGDHPRQGAVYIATARSSPKVGCRPRRHRHGARPRRDTVYIADYTDCPSLGVVCADSQLDKAIGYIDTLMSSPTRHHRSDRVARSQHANPVLPLVEGATSPQHPHRRASSTSS